MNVEFWKGARNKNYSGAHFPRGCSNPESTFTPLTTLITQYCQRSELFNEGLNESVLQKVSE